MYVFGEEMSLVDSNANFVGDALSKLDFFVMQEIFFSETCRFADVILPATPSLEKEGTFTSTERRIQRLYEVFEPLDGSRPDWIIIQDIANRLGAGWKYAHPSQICEEIASLTPLMAGVTYERLEGYKTLQLGAVDLALWKGAYTSRHHHESAGKRAVHAHELHCGGGKPPDQQSH
jgi:formate dehydrogenase major subunit